MLQLDVWINRNGRFIVKTTMEKMDGGVCAAAGFLAGSLKAGIKRVFSEKDDLAVVLSESPCVAAGVFTQNRVQAAPVLISKKNLGSGCHRGVVLNSGNANACTGEQGLADAEEMCRLAAEKFGGSQENYLVCSTGRIGVPMPMEKVRDGFDGLPERLSCEGNREAAVAIMTSDTHPKEAAFSFSLGGKQVKVGGMAKGAGMINPNMATMLCVITTDAELDGKLAQQILADVVERTFNRITIDGDMSTNDTVLLLGNGKSGVKIMEDDAEATGAFTEVVERVCSDLARMIVGDGEGTTKIVEIDLRGASSLADAKKAAEAVANSVLLKCAWAGQDPNWGRIVDALGYSGADFDPSAIDIFYDELHLVKGGQLGPADPKKVKQVAEKQEFTITIDLGGGDATYRVLSSDLTEEYVRLNLSE